MQAVNYVQFLPHWDCKIYESLPMGVSGAPDIAQEAMTWLLKAVSRAGGKSSKTPEACCIILKPLRLQATWKYLASRGTLSLHPARYRRQDVPAAHGQTSTGSYQVQIDAHMLPPVVKPMNGVFVHPQTWPCISYKTKQIEGTSSGSKLGWAEANWTCHLPWSRSSKPFSIQAHFHPPRSLGLELPRGKSEVCLEYEHSLVLAARFQFQKGYLQCVKQVKSEFQTTR